MFIFFKTIFCGATADGETATRETKYFFLFEDGILGTGGTPAAATAHANCCFGCCAVVCCVCVATQRTTYRQATWRDVTWRDVTWRTYGRLPIYSVTWWWLMVTWLVGKLVGRHIYIFCLFRFVRLTIARLTICFFSHIYIIYAFSRWL